MGKIRDIGCESRPNAIRPRLDMTIVCLEGNGCRPSHKGDGWNVGGDVYIE